jgi:hypothetical protein
MELASSCDMLFKQATVRIIADSIATCYNVIVLVTSKHWRVILLWTVRSMYEVYESYRR